MASNVTAIAAATYHSMFLKSDGSLWGMGSDGYGQLGTSMGGNTNQPEQIVSSNVTAVAIAGTDSLFVNSDGSLCGMGLSQYGQLGDGTIGGTNRPEQIVASNVTAIAAGDWHSLFLKSDGSLWAMGYNSHGQLGDGSYHQTNRPMQVVINPSYNQISGQLLSGGSVSLPFFGIAGANYALDRSFSLAPPNWLPQATNPANSFGALAFTNTPSPAMNNFWRIRAVP